MKQYLLGIDVGTTGTKTLLVSVDGVVVKHAYRSYETDTPMVGWSEQRAEDWWQAVTETVKELCAEAEVAENVAAISLSVQGGTIVATDAEFCSLHPALVWNDSRCESQRDAFLHEVGTDADLYQITGWHLTCGSPVLQLRWLRENRPEIFAKAVWFLSVPDYICAKMTGVPTVDLSSAGINRLCDIKRGIYAEKLLEFVGISKEKLPRIVHSGEAVGHLTEKAAQELGLTTKTVVVAGAHDQYAVALGAGACKPGDLVIGTGTCWVITAISDTPHFASGLNQSIAAIPNTWGTLWSLPSGGVCLEWLRKKLHQDEKLMTYEKINQTAASRHAAEEGLFFYPFSGRSEAGKTFRRGTFVGLDLSHDIYDLARAVMEGVAFQIVWMLGNIHMTPGTAVRLSGGASQSELWCQIVADTAGVPVVIPQFADLACVGAAILAGCGCEIYSDAAEGYETLAVQEKIIEPDNARAKQYRGLLEAYIKQAKQLGTLYKI